MQKNSELRIDYYNLFDNDHSDNNSIYSISGVDSFYLVSIKFLTYTSMVYIDHSDPNCF